MVCSSYHLVMEDLRRWFRCIDHGLIHRSSITEVHLGAKEILCLSEQRTRTVTRTAKRSRHLPIPARAG